MQDTPGLDYVKSFSRSGEAVIYVNLRDDIDNDKIRPTWLEVRNMVDDIKRIYQKAFMGHIIMTDLMMYMVLYMLSQVMVILMKKCVKGRKIRRILLTVDNVSKVELVGEQPEKYI